MRILLQKSEEKSISKRNESAGSSVAEELNKVRMKNFH